MDKKNNYEEDVKNIDEIDGFDIKIKPDYYLHKALEKAQIALIKDDMQTGLIQFRLLIEHMEVIAKAAKMIDEDFDKKIEEYRKTEEVTREDNDTVKSVKIANKKLELIFENIMQSATYSGAISLVDK